MWGIYFCIFFLAFLSGFFVVSAENSDWKYLISSERIFQNSQKFSSIFYDDSHILRFVNTAIPLSHREYAPKNLVPVAGEFINEAGRKSFVRADVKVSLDLLAKDFFEHFSEKIIIVSAFRSAQYQQRLWDLWKCNDGAFCAKPGRSEHQLGLGADFFDASTAEEYEKNPRYKAFFEWMKAHAYKYGWTQSYQNGPWVEWYEIEPWHWRFVGTEMANFLHKNQISYTQFLRWNAILQKK